MKSSSFNWVGCLVYILVTAIAWCGFTLLKQDDGDCSARVQDVEAVQRLTSDTIFKSECSAELGAATIMYGERSLYIVDSTGSFFTDKSAIPLGTDKHAVAKLKVRETYLRQIRSIDAKNALFTHGALWELAPGGGPGIEPSAQTIDAAERAVLHEGSRQTQTPTPAPTPGPSVQPEPQAGNTDFDEFKHRIEQRLRARMAKASTATPPAPAAAAAPEQNPERFAAELDRLQQQEAFLNVGGSIIPRIGFSSEGQKLSVEEAKKQIKTVFADLVTKNANWLVSYRAPNQKHEIVVFTDPTCPYCRRLHNSIGPLNDQGVTVHYMMYPRAFSEGRDSDVAIRVEASLKEAWCAKDLAGGFNDLFAGRAIRDSNCDEFSELDRQAFPIDGHYLIADVFGVYATPTIITDKGEIITGFSGEAGLLSALK